jgi:hypothetical protein
MEELRPEIDGELMSVEVDVETPDVPAYAVTALEQHDIPLPIEQPRYRNARHAGADDRYRSPRLRRVCEHRSSGSCGNRFQHIASRPGCVHPRLLQAN